MQSTGKTRAISLYEIPKDKQWEKIDDVEKCRSVGLPDTNGDCRFPLCSKLCSKRWIVAFALCLLHVCTSALHKGMGIALVCMTSETDNHDITNDVMKSTNSCVSSNATTGTDGNHLEFHWSSVFEAHVLSGGYYGYLLTLAVAGYLDRMLGSCRLLLLTLVLGGGLSLVTPVLTRKNQNLLIVIRVFIGIACGVVKPAVFSILSNWATISERGTITSVTFAGTGIGSILTSFASGFLCSIPVDNGWPFVFYVVGTACLVCAVGWKLFVYDSPDRHPTVSQAERDYISRDMTHENTEGKIHAPWLKMAKCSAVWAILVADATHHWISAAFVIYLPLYIRDVLKLHVTKIGMLTAAPYVGSTLLGLVAGPLADRMLRSMPVVYVRKIFEMAGCLGFAVCILCVSWLGSQNVWVSVTLLVTGVSLLNLTSTAFKINSLDIAPRYASFLTSLSTSLGTVLSMTAPQVTSVILTTKSEAEWRIVLIIVSAVCLAGAVFYVIFARGDEQEWARLNSYDVTVSVVTDVALRHRSHSITMGLARKSDPCLPLSATRLQDELL